jgi:hypothetical protein
MVNGRKEPLYFIFSIITSCVVSMIFFFRPMGLLDLMVWICFRIYLE